MNIPAKIDFLFVVFYSLKNQKQYTEIQNVNSVCISKIAKFSGNTELVHNCSAVNKR
jgi:hypothetical protein